MPATPFTRPKLALNLSGPGPDTTELPFVDVFLCRSPSHPMGAGAAGVTLDAAGYPASLPAGTWVQWRCPAPWAAGMAGTAVLLYDGAGTVAVDGAGVVSATAPGRLELSPSPKAVPGSPLIVQLKVTDPANPVKNIRVLLPGCETSYQAQPFRKGFLDAWRGLACARSLYWTRGIATTESAWSDRSTGAGGYFTAGVPWETFAALCTEWGCDAWPIIPIRATDDYCHNLAVLFRDHTPAWTRILGEPGCECWNHGGGYPTAAWAVQQGQATGQPGTVTEAAWRWYAIRSAQMFRIFADVLGNRFVGVVGTQLASLNGWLAGRILGYDGKTGEWKPMTDAPAPDLAGLTGAIAVAPYAQLHVGAPGAITPDAAKAMTPDALALATAADVARLTLRIREHAALARALNLELVAYEWAQDLRGVAAAQADPALTAACLAAQRTPMMGTLYRSLSGAWRDAGGGVACHTMGAAPWGASGSYGLGERPGDKTDKLAATLQWARECGQVIAGP